MTGYLVEMRGEVREVYYVEADTEEEAIANWFEGQLFMSETMGVDFYSCREEED